jgi:PD-(D/E)XK nuclease superfamily
MWKHGSNCRHLLKYLLTGAKKNRGSEISGHLDLSRCSRFTLYKLQSLITISNKMTSRFYTINGRDYPSVTTILNVINKPQLIDWAVRITRDYVKQELFALQRADSLQDLNVDGLLAKSSSEHNRVKRAAANRGTDIHHRIAASIDDEDDFACDQDPVVNAFRTWQDEAKFAPIATEKLVFSREHSYAGTADLIGMVNGKLAVLDIKTGRGVYPEYKLQLAAYAVAWGEMTGHFPEVCINLHVRSDFTIIEANTFTGSELLPLFQTFLAAKRLFEWHLTQQIARQNGAATRNNAASSEVLRPATVRQPKSSSRSI